MGFQVLSVQRSEGRLDILARLKSFFYLVLLKCLPHQHELICLRAGFGCHGHGPIVVVGIHIIMCALPEK